MHIYFGFACNQFSFSVGQTGLFKLNENACRCQTSFSQRLPESQVVMLFSKNDVIFRSDETPSRKGGDNKGPKIAFIIKARSLNALSSPQ